MLYLIAIPALPYQLEERASCNRTYVDLTICNDDGGCLSFACDGECGGRAPIEKPQYGGISSVRRLEKLVSKWIGCSTRWIQKSSRCNVDDCVRSLGWRRLTDQRQRWRNMPERAKVHPAQAPLLA